MTYPAMTAFYAGLFGFLFVALSLWVSMARFAHGVHHGDGGRTDLNRRIRAHANFAEYVPLTLLLIGLAEAGGAAPQLIQALLALLLAARIAHPLGMVAAERTVRQFALRGLPILVTWAILAAAAVLVII